MIIRSFWYYKILINREIWPSDDFTKVFYDTVVTAIEVPDYMPRYLRPESYYDRTEKKFVMDSVGAFRITEQQLEDLIRFPFIDVVSHSEEVWR